METLYTLSSNAVFSHLTKAIRCYIPKQMKTATNVQTHELIKSLFPIYSSERPFTLPIKFSNTFFKTILKNNNSIDINELVSLLINSNIFILTELDVSKSGITNESIEKANNNNNNNIVSLDISNCRKVLLSQFASGGKRWWVDTLEELGMQNSVTPQSITSISSYPNLRVLDISGTTLAIGKGNNKLMRNLLGDLTNLEEIDISETNIPLKWLAEFKHAPKLKKITANFKIEKRGIQPLSYFEPPKSLAYLDISSNIHSPVSKEKLYESRLAPQSAKTIQKLLSLPNLKHLDVSFCGISKENISLFMGKETRLDFLGLFGNDVAIVSSELPAKIVTGYNTISQLLTSIKYYRYRPDYMKIILQSLRMKEKKHFIRMQTSEYIEAIRDIVACNKWTETSLSLLNMFLEHCRYSLIISKMDVGLNAKDLYSLLVRVLCSTSDSRALRGVLLILKELSEQEHNRIYAQDILSTTRLRAILITYLENSNLSAVNRDAAIIQEILSIISHINSIMVTNTVDTNSKKMQNCSSSSTVQVEL